MENKLQQELTGQTKKSAIVVLETRVGIYPIPINSIVAVEKVQHSERLIIYTKTDILTGVNSTLHQLKEACPDNFIYLNRQSIINKVAINHIVPKSRTIYIKIRDNELKPFVCSRTKLRELIKWLESIAGVNGGSLVSSEN